MRIQFTGPNLNKWQGYTVYLIVAFLILLVGIAALATWRHINHMHDQERSLQEQKLYHDPSQ